MSNIRKGIVVGRITSPQKINMSLSPGTCEYVTLYGKISGAGKLRLTISCQLKCGDYSGRVRWTCCVYRGPYQVEEGCADVEKTCLHVASLELQNRAGRRDWAAQMFPKEDHFTYAFILSY